MDFRQLRSFVAVAEELHFTRAARRLRVAQPPLSRQIRQLEAELGVHLFERTKRKVELTQVGALFLPEALKLLKQLEVATLVAQRAARGEIGLLHIATTSALPYMGLLPKVLHAYRELFPHVQLVLREMNTRQQLDALHAGEIDVGFLRLPMRTLPSRISVQVVQSEPMCIALRQDHPLAPMKTVDLARLADEPFIMYPYDLGGGLHDLSIALCKQAGFTPKVEQEARTVAMAVSFAAAGLGVALVPASIRNVHTPGAVYRPLRGRSARTEIAVAHRSNDRSPRVTAFVKLSLTFRNKAGGPGE
jgi:DNA-binding transcriptional LysR family regulator